MIGIGFASRQLLTSSPSSNAIFFFFLTKGLRASWVLIYFPYWHSNAKTRTTVLFIVGCVDDIFFQRQERRGLFLLNGGAPNPVQDR